MSRDIVGGVPRQPTGDEAAELLATLMNRELGASATADAIKRLIRERWGRLSILAHAVHDQVGDR